jgi:hypothetical protein
VSPDPIRSVFVQWPLLLDDGERLLSDLRELTDLNTIELSNFYVDWGDQSGTVSEATPLALPPSDAFGDLPVPLVDEETFARVVAGIDVARAHGFRVLVNVTPLYFGFPAPPALSCVDVRGERVPGLRPDLPVYGCPSSDEVVRYAEAMTSEFVRTWPLDGVTLNHLEYPFWPQRDVREILTCFCEACAARAEDEGVDFEAIQREVASGYEAFRADGLPSATPLLREWLDFRRRGMSALGRRLVAATRPAAVGLEVQAPRITAAVGTDAEGLAPLVDWLSPKFPDYLAAAVVPTIAAEPELRRELRALLELGAGPDEYEAIESPREGILYANAFDEAMIDLQAPRLASLRGRPLHPYLWLYGGDVESFAAKRRALERNGLEGFFLWCWSTDLTTEALRRMAAAGVAA